MKPELLKQLLQKAPMRLNAETGNIVTCPVRLVGPFSLWKPHKPMQAGGNEKYIARLLFPAEADVSILKEGVARIAKENFSNTAGLRNPLRDQAEKDGYDGYEAGAIFCNASNTRRPAIVDRSGRHPITDEDEIYAGMWAICALRLYAYSAQGNRGIGVGLQHVQKIMDDDKLSGGTNPEVDFAPIDVPDQGANASLEDMF